MSKNYYQTNENILLMNSSN